MKTIEELLNSTPVFLNDWEEKIDVIGDFEDIRLTGKEYRAEVSPYPNSNYWEDKRRQMSRAIEKYKNVNILFATYTYEDYTGDAWVLFEQDGKLYEVNGSHCSCYGLEGQWDAEEVNLKELEHRLLNGTFGEDNYSVNEFKSELKAFLGL